MSRVLCIPDVHLKPVMFDKAEKILDSGQADFAIQLGDIVDDWGEEFNIDLYERTLNRAAKFYEGHPDTLWVVGNHDYGYLHKEYGRRETGHSKFTEIFIVPLLEKLPQQIAHIVDGVLFTHAGLTLDWMNRRLEKVGYKEEKPPIDRLAHIINYATPEELWQEDGPIWARPHLDRLALYPVKLQVCGHTPVRDLRCLDGLLETDTHSTYKNGAPFGDKSFAMVDTETKEWTKIQEE